MFPKARIVWNKDDGFSLVELMIVVAIIGILAGLAVPKFNLFQAKARQAEVKTNLSSIYTLQQSYFGDKDEYFEFGAVSKTSCLTAADLGFTPSPCAKLRYTYTSDFAPTRTTFRATGTATMGTIYPGCKAPGAVDTWTIDQDKKLGEGNGLVACGGG
jgi:prepilin-type N-terminal cleavage/methylation domain-containing protein